MSSHRTSRTSCATASRHTPIRARSSSSRSYRRPSRARSGASSCASATPPTASTSAVAHEPRARACVSWRGGQHRLLVVRCDRLCDRRGRCRDERPVGRDGSLEPARARLPRAGERAPARRSRLATSPCVRGRRGSQRRGISRAAALGEPAGRELRASARGRARGSRGGGAPPREDGARAREAPLEGGRGARRRAIRAGAR